MNVFRKVIGFFLKKALEGRELLSMVYDHVIIVVNKLIFLFEKQLFLIENKSYLIVKTGSELMDSFGKQSLFLKRFGGQVRERFFILFEKRKLQVKGVVADVLLEYFRLTSYFRGLVQKKVDALVTNRLFIAFAILVQKVFWVCAGISIYAGILIKTQPDGHERVMGVLKHLFFWMW